MKEEVTGNQRQVRCLACGSTFGCCLVPISSCWCSKVEVSDTVLVEIRRKFSDCICPDCLNKFVSDKASSKV